MRVAKYLLYANQVGQNTSEFAQITHGVEQILAMAIPLAVGVMGAVLLWPEDPAKKNPPQQC